MFGARQKPAKSIEHLSEWGKISELYQQTFSWASEYYYQNMSSQARGWYWLGEGDLREKYLQPFAVTILGCQSISGIMIPEDDPNNT